MATTITGKLQYDPRVNKGGYFSVKLADNETYYGCGKKDPGLKRGDVVSFEAEQNGGGYWNVTGAILKSVNSPANSAQSAGGGTTGGGGGSKYDRVFPVPPRHGDRSIIRQNALAHATALVLKNGADLVAGDLTHAANTIIGIAKIFEAHAAGDEERRQDEAKKAAAVAAQMTGGGE